MAKNITDPGYFSALAQTMKKREESRDKEMQPKCEEEHLRSAINAFLGAREIELLIREFNPTRNPDLFAAEWINEIELLGIIHKWDPYHLLLYSSMRLTGIARTWYEYSLESISDWEDFKQELINNFPRSIDSADVHSKLVEKKRSANETLEEYFHTTVKLAKRIKMDDDSIKDYLIRGLESSKDQMILSSIGPCSLTEFLRHMQRLEGDSSSRSSSSSRQRYSLPGSSRGVSPRRDLRINPVNPRPPPLRFRDRLKQIKRLYSPDGIPEANTMVKQEKTRNCYICKSTEHLAANCNRKRSAVKSQKQDIPIARSDRESETKKPRVCYNCRKEGHTVRSCPEPKLHAEGFKRDGKHQQPVNKHPEGKSIIRNEDKLDLEIDLDAVELDMDLDDE